MWQVMIVIMIAMLMPVVMVVVAITSTIIRMNVSWRRMDAAVAEESRFNFTVPGGDNLCGGIDVA